MTQPIVESPPEPFTLNYLPRQYRRRYSPRAIALFVLSCVGGPLVIAPWVMLDPIADVLPSGPAVTLRVIAIVIGLMIGLAIPWQCVAELRALPGPQHHRGKKLLRRGLALYALWYVLPVLLALLYLSLFFLYLAVPFGPHPPAP
jgi:hypothetical protein